MPSPQKEEAAADAAAWRVRRPRVAAGLLLAAAVLSGAAGAWYWLRTEVPDPPAIALAEADPPAAEAIREATAAVTRSPRSAAAWGRLGVALLAFRYIPEAITCFACAERLAPRDPRWPYLQVSWREPSDPEAIPKLQRSVDLSSDPPEAVRLHLAEALIAQGRLDDAEPLVRAALRRDPASPRAHLDLARLAFARGNLAESAASLRHAAASPFTRKAAGLLLAQVHQAAGDAAAAAEAVERSGQLPDDRPFPAPYFAQETERLLADKNALSLAEALANQGRLAEAIAVLHRLATRYPDWGPPWLFLGQLLVEANDYAAAEPALTNAVRLLPGSAKPHFYLGVALAERGRPGDAAASFRRATALHPSYAEAHYGLSRCLQALDDRDGAVESLRAAVRYLPSYVQARVALGELLARAGRRGEALAELRRAARLRPEDEKIQKLIRELEAQPPADPPP